MSIKPKLIKSKQLQHSLILLIIPGIFSLGCYRLSQGLFDSYYAETWGYSAIGMHSPPFGTNYPSKAQMVGGYSILVSFPVGLFITWLFVRDKKVK